MSKPNKAPSPKKNIRLDLVWKGNKDRGHHNLRMLLTFCACKKSSRDVKGKIYLVYWYNKVILNLSVVIHRIREKFPL